MAQILRLVDYEYSGNNDPCFELGNICNENDFAPEQFEQLCAAYFGQASTSKVARMWLYYCMSNIGWVLWGSIQNSISAIDFDFWEWTLVKWRKAQAQVESPEFGQVAGRRHRDELRMNSSSGVRIARRRTLASIS